MTHIEHISTITTCEVGTVIAVHDRGPFSSRGLLLARGPIERSFLAAWAMHGPGEYELEFDREWACISAFPAARGNP